MSAAFALILLMESVGACGAAASAERPVGAEAVKAVLEFESEASEASPVTPASAVQSAAEGPAGAIAGTDEPAEARCRIAPLSIA